MAEIVPFPLIRRRGYIRRQAARIAEASPMTGEKLLAHAIRQQIATMERRGISGGSIAEQARALECAIRAELWRVVLQPGGAA
jgi:hypothetical protein